MEFYINEDGNFVIDKESFLGLLGELDKLAENNPGLMSGGFPRKKEFCCVVRFYDKFIDQHQYKEYPIFAEAVCVRHTLKDCGTDEGCNGQMSHGECDVPPVEI